MLFYSDKHGIFRTTHASQKDRTSGLTQFGRALYELNIDTIAAANAYASEFMADFNRHFGKEPRNPDQLHPGGGSRLCSRGRF